VDYRELNCIAISFFSCAELCILINDSQGDNLRTSDNRENKQTSESTAAFFPRGVHSSDMPLEAETRREQVNMQRAHRVIRRAGDQPSPLPTISQLVDQMEGNSDWSRQQQSPCLFSQPESSQAERSSQDILTPAQRGRWNRGQGARPISSQDNAWLLPAAKAV
jgi:hypothetical protein